MICDIVVYTYCGAAETININDCPPLPPSWYACQKGQGKWPGERRAAKILPCLYFSWRQQHSPEASLPPPPEIKWVPPPASPDILRFLERGYLLTDLLQPAGALVQQMTRGRAWHSLLKGTQISVNHELLDHENEFTTHTVFSSLWISTWWY